MRYTFSLFFVFALSLCYAQSTVTIRIIDGVSKDGLIGATVTTLSANYISDLEGNISYQPQNFPDSLLVEYLGYGDEILIISDLSRIPSTIKMSDNLILETMTVTASKYEKRLSESTVSVDILKPEIISNANIINIDDALDKVSGVQMVDGQANIRGGSGYSYGAGSRVMLLIDDMPALQTDAGFPNWGDIPTENIDQVEIVKGAASSLYGSAALNGIINIRTGTPTTTPQTKIASSYLMYDSPADTAKNWYGDTTRYAYMVSGVHKQKFGKLDVVANGFYYKEESFLKATFENRYRLGLKLKYQLADKAFIGINTLYNNGDNGDFFLWENGDERAVNPLPGSATTQQNKRYFVDPSLTVEDEFGNTHRLLTRYHSIENNNTNNQSNQSKTYYGEYQFQRMIASKDLLLTSGIVASQSDTDAELFGDTTFTTKIFAYYGQLEKSFGNLNLTGGLRYEYNQQNTPEEFAGISVPNGEISEGRWIGRLGASYEYMPYSSLRASWGQGYRFPTITERFITTTFGIFSIVANPTLIPESGWTAEIGVRQGFKIGGFKGFLDGAIFTSQYADMMEFTFGFEGFSPTFRAENVGDTKINGMEIGLFGAVDIGKVSLTGFGGYTYIDPQYTNYEGNDSLRLGLSADVNVLKYRGKHNGKFDLQAEYNNLSFGISYIKSSHVVNIDAVLEGRGFEFAQNPDILGIKAYRETNNNGWQRWDMRIAYQIADVKLSFLVNNILNTEYTLRPALLEAPRSFTFRLDYILDWKTSAD